MGRQCSHAEAVKPNGVLVYLHVHGVKLITGAYAPESAPPSK